MDGFRLDSPVDLLAFDYVRYGLLTIVNNIWAWIAVVTAAISFWRMRTLSMAAQGRRCFVDSSPAAAEERQDRVPGETEGLVSSLRKMATTSFCVPEGEGSPKRKFVTYYNEEDFDGRDEDDGGAPKAATATATATVNEILGIWCDEWKRNLVLRMGDLGWYRRQDLGMLDRSVVRFWEPQRLPGKLYIILRCQG